MDCSMSSEESDVGYGKSSVSLTIDFDAKMSQCDGSGDEEDRSGYDICDGGGGGCRPEDLSFGMLPSLPMERSDSPIVSSPPASAVKTGVPEKLPTPDQDVFDGQGLQGKKGTPPKDFQPCPPTPMRAPFWAHEQEGPFALLRKNSLCQSKVLVTMPSYQTSPSSHAKLSDEFAILSRIGSGTFSEVFKVRSRADERLFAMKKAKRQFRSRKDRERYLKEITTFQKLGPSCPYVIQYYKAWQEDGFFFTLTELCERGNLKDFLEALGEQPVPEPTLWSWCLYIAAGLHHIHQSDLVHLDIKPQNIFLTEDGTLKIGDFGLVRESGSCEDGLEGDHVYMAKELLKCNAKTPSADIFSFGITIYEAASGLQPPEQGQIWHDMREGKIPPLPRHLGRSDDLSALIVRMMHEDPARRPSTGDILKHRLVDAAATTKDDFVVSTPNRSAASLAACESVSRSWASSAEESNGALPSSSDSSSAFTPRARPTTDNMKGASGGAGHTSSSSSDSSKMGYRSGCSLSTPRHLGRNSLSFGAGGTPSPFGTTPVHSVGTPKDSPITFGW